MRKYRNQALCPLPVVVLKSPDIILYLPQITPATHRSLQSKQRARHVWIIKTLEEIMFLNVPLKV